MPTMSSLDRVLGVVIFASNCLASVWIFVITMAIVADVSFRFLFNAPISGITELVTMSVVAVLYMQLAYTLRSGYMTRSDAVLRRLTVGRPRLGNALNALFCLAGAALMIAIMARAWPKWVAAYDADFYVGVVGVFTFPEWPRLLIVFIGCGLTGLQFLLISATSAASIRRPATTQRPQ